METRETRSPQGSFADRVDGFRVVSPPICLALPVSAALSHTVIKALRDGGSSERWSIGLPRGRRPRREPGIRSGRIPDWSGPETVMKPIARPLSSDVPAIHRRRRTASGGLLESRCFCRSMRTSRMERRSSGRFEVRFHSRASESGSGPGAHFRCSMTSRRDECLAVLPLRLGSSAWVPIRTTPVGG